MSRLIDADKLMEQKFKNPISYNAFVNLVKRQPTVEPKQGQWEVGGKICGLDYSQCSLCKTWVDIPSPYCPHCGAYMGEVEE